MELHEAQSRVRVFNAGLRERPLEGKDSMGLVTHLAEEVAELRESLIHDSIEEVAEEMADIAVILLALASAEDVELESQFKLKMEKNEKRAWQKPDKKGVIRHKPITATEAHDKHELPKPTPVMLGDPPRPRTPPEDQSPQGSDPPGDSR